ncbi:hypothetical protein Cni_G07240 [Canna indica]|uniref:FAS1 domain-containing protein n=1 Tax=Canna indica TaxID=4628 RepID=A0AAQ3Q5J7_9LILI|nr:hypothetical protein Cni_G07240 [Canna indica]
MHPRLLPLHCLPPPPITMASTSVSTVLNLFILAILAAVVARAQPTASPPAPAGPPNITDILAKGGQYTSFVRLLHSTRVADQLNIQLNSTYNGLTVFAPTDNAFNALKAGALNALSGQEQIELALFHVLPRFYSLTAFQTVSNPLLTEASGKSGQWTLNVTAVTSTQQVNVSTGVVEVPVNSAVHADSPLAVYSVEKVLLPYEIFGPKPPAAAPAPAKKTGPPAADGGSSSTTAAAPGDGSSGAAALKGREVGWGFVAGVGLWGMVAAGNML